jgi:hypothetical protein
MSITMAPRLQSETTIAECAASAHSLQALLARATAPVFGRAQTAPAPNARAAQGTARSAEASSVSR